MVVKLLLERGADVHAVNDEGHTPYRLSFMAGYLEIMGLIREHGGR